MAGPCPACGGPAPSHWRAATASDPQLAGGERFSLRRCRRCGTAFTVGDAADRESMYEGGTYAPVRGPLAALTRPLRRVAERDRMRFLTGIPPRSRVLEVGAGDGDLVARMRAAGLDAWGIEPSPAAAAAAAARGVEVERAGIEGARVAAASQDAVVLWHSLEHLDDPAAAARSVAGWLRPGGRAIVAVPNLASLQAAIGADRWFHQDVPRHRTHFTPAGIRALLEGAGLRVIRIRHLAVEQNPLGMWQTLLNLVTVERDFAFRALKRDLARASGRARARDALMTAIAALPLAVVAVVLELAAGLAGRGGSIVVEAVRP